MPSAVPVTKDTHAEFKYLEWRDVYKTEGALEIVSEKDPRKTNLRWFTAAPEPLNDVRGRQTEFALDKNGFQWIEHETKMSYEDFKDKEKVERIYLPESQSTYRQFVEDADEVIFINWQLRSSESGAKKGANKEVHIDQSPMEVERYVRRMYLDRADFLLRGRVRVINLWRPITGPVQNWPLALCDYSSVSPDVSLEFDRVLDHKIITARMVMQDPNMKWYYMADQTSNEATLLKCHDTMDGVAKGIPHTSVALPEATESTPARESIEVRAYVFTYPKGEKP